MLISQVMTPDVIVASPDDHLQYAAELMEKEDFGILPVCENGRLIGMLSDRDITIRAAAKGLALDQTKVSEVMTAEARYVFEDQTTEYASAYMNEFQVRRLPVLDRNHRLAGILSLGDLALTKEEAAMQALSGVSAPSNSHGL